MECVVIGGCLVRVDVHRVPIFLKGEKEVRELMHKLSDALFEIKDFERKEVSHDGPL